MMATAGGQREQRQIGGMPGFSVAEVVYAPGAHQAWHDHEETRLIVVVRGGFTESWARREYCCEAASALLRPAGERHTDRYSGQGTLCINVRLGGDWEERLAGLGMRAAGGSVADVAGLAGRLYGEVRAGDAASPLGIQCSVLEILSRLLRVAEGRRGRKAPGWIESTKELVRSRAANPPDLAEAARAAGVHPAHLARSFRQFTGMSVGAFARRMRVEAACARLRNSVDALAEIAAETGFSDQAHFSRVFRREMGMSPREFRRMERGRSGWTQ